MTRSCQCRGTCKWRVRAYYDAHVASAEDSGGDSACIKRNVRAELLPIGFALRY